MQLIKFCGRNKKDSVKKAMMFFYDNYESMGLEEFLAKCRVQEDNKTVHFYPDLEVDIKKFRELKKKLKDRKKK